MKPLSPRTNALLLALRAAAHGENPEENGWCMIYLDNAVVPGMSAAAKSGHFSALENAGLYKPEDGFAWGHVKMASA